MNDEEALVLKQLISGLVQAARQFFKKLRDILIEKMGFEKCVIDQCLFSRKGKTDILIISLYINDTIVNEVEMKTFKEDITLRFKTKEERHMKDYVGYMVARKKIRFFVPN